MFSVSIKTVGSVLAGIMAVTASATALESSPEQIPAPVTLTVTQQNSWKLSSAEMINYFRQLDTDLLCIQEAQGITEEEMEAAGLYVHKFANNKKGPVAIISRLPFKGFTPNNYGVYLEAGNGVSVLVMNCHAAHKPYGPYQFAGISYGKGDGVTDPEEIYRENREAREPMVDLLLEDIRSSETDHIILCGDFNEPSWMDWTEATTAAGITPCPIAWPVTRLLWEGGLKGDAYRTIHPDPVTHPGITWSPKPAEKDTEDRIDFILYNVCENMKVKECKIVGEASDKADIVITPWIFDHRGVRAVFQFD